MVGAFAAPSAAAGARTRSAARRGGTGREVLVHTGQHFDPMMSEVFFAELEIPAPDHHLGIHGGGHGAMTGEMLKALEPVLQDEAPTGCWCTATPTPPSPPRWPP